MDSSLTRGFRCGLANPHPDSGEPLARGPAALGCECQARARGFVLLKQQKALKFFQKERFPRSYRVVKF